MRYTRYFSFPFQREKKNELILNKILKQNELKQLMTLTKRLNISGVIRMLPFK